MRLFLFSFNSWQYIGAVYAETDSLWDTQDLLSGNIFTDRVPGATVDEFPGSNIVDLLNIGDSDWLLENGNIDLNPLSELYSNMFPADTDGLMSFTGSDSNLPFDSVDWDLQPESVPDSSLPDADLITLVSATDPSSLLRDSIWDHINSPLADDQIGCVVGLADDVTLFDKRRRANQCSNPDQEKPDLKPEAKPKRPEDIGSDPSISNLVPWARDNVLLNYAFPENFEICPKDYFRDSNSPVCKEQVPYPDQIYTVPGYWSNLYDVSPGMSMYDLKHSPTC